MIWEFIIAAGVAAGAGPTDCAAPAWFRSEALKLGLAKDDMVGFGKGRDVDLAAREARRELGAQVVKRYGDEILADARVKQGVNLKAYTRDEVLAAMPLAAAADLGGYSRVKGDTVCGVRYVAYAVGKGRALASLLRGGKDFPQHVNMALVGKINEVEKDVASDEPPIAAGKAPELGGAEMTLAKLKKAGETLDGGGLVEAQLRDALKARTERLAAAIKAVRAPEAEAAKRASAVDDAQELARKQEVFLAATRDYHAGNYLTAFETFIGLAREGDVTAQFAVGVMYFEGQGQRKSLHESYEWLRRAADQNHGPSKMMVGMFYFSGYGVKANHAEAFKWFNSAAQQGWTCEAQLNACKRTAL